MRKASVYMSLLAVASVLSGVGTAAYADAVGDGFASAQSGITTTISTYAIPLIVAVLLVGLGIGLLVKYVRKGVRAA